MPRKVRARKGSLLWNTWQAATKCMDLYRKISVQTRHKLQPLFQPVQESYLDWFRSAYQSSCNDPQFNPGIPFDFIAASHPIPSLIFLHILSKEPFTLFVSEHPFENFESVITVERIKRGFPCTHRQHTRKKTDFFTASYSVPANDVLHLHLKRKSFYSFSLTPPTPNTPAPSFFPIISGQKLFQLFS